MAPGLRRLFARGAGLVALGALVFSAYLPVADASAAAQHAVGPATTGVSRVLPLSSGKPFPPSWARTGPMVTRPGAGHDLTQPGLPPPETSANWSGYVDSGQGARFSQVSAMWTVPAVNPHARGDSATWVGIDGFGNNDLIQAGTDQAGGDYYAWYELIPQFAFSLGNVHPGDQMYVDIVQDVPGTWTVTVRDVTRDVTWTGPVAYAASGASAEWVEEAPTNQSNNIEVLANFGSVKFTQLAVSGPGTSGAVGQPVYLVNNHNAVKAYPAAYDQGTDSLEVRYGSPPSGIVGYPAVPIDSASPQAATTGAIVPADQHGYWLASADGGVFTFGSAHFYGSAAADRRLSPTAGMAATSDNRGYWLATADGGVFSFGDATYHGSLPGLGLAAYGTTTTPGERRLNAPVVGIARSVAGHGYYLVGADGGVFAFGDAHFRGSCVGDPACNAPAVALVADATGQGYWLLLANAKMVPFGDAAAIGDGDCQHQAAESNLTATAAARTLDGRGYWVVLQNGTTCAEGDALTESIWEAQGPTDRQHPAVAIITDYEGLGAWLVMSTGTVDRYGDAPRIGGLNGYKLGAPIVAATGF